jgi:hypothetical protein
VVRQNVVLAFRLCSRAHELNPSHRLVPGFIASSQCLLGALDHNAGLFDDAYRQLLQNTHDFPQFNGFVQGSVVSGMVSRCDYRYGSSIDGYFASITSCAGIPLPRFWPHAGRLGYGIVYERSRHCPLCYNTCIAPHNLEGSFLGLGDAYLKQGRLCQARTAYRSVRRVPSYGCWKFKDQLETRLANLKPLACKFEADTGQFDVTEPAMLVQSRYACTGCHAR